MNWALRLICTDTFIQQFMYVYLRRLGVDMDQELALENKLFYFEAEPIRSTLETFYLGSCI